MSHTHSPALPWVFITDYTAFNTQVITASHQHPILVDFWADWCAPCRVLTPHLLRVIEEYAGALYLAQVEVDVDENMKLAGHYRLRGFPTVILFKDGEERGRFTGGRTSSYIREWLHTHLPSQDGDVAPS